MLGNILYLHVYNLSDLIAVNQELNPSRFVKVIEEIPVKGGREGEYGHCRNGERSRRHLSGDQCFPLYRADYSLY